MEARMTDDDPKKILEAFHEAVNMTPSELEKWLETEHSKEVGWADGEPKASSGGHESVGHHSGRKIIAIKRARVNDLDASDYAHMQKVVGYAHRNIAQKPKSDVRDSRWRYSLMNWGHDPLKD
jgi:hypothetical protein